MAEYRIVVARSAEREFVSLPLSVQRRITAMIDSLASVPRPPRVKKLAGTADLWRIRVGEYRIVYRIDDARRLVDITRIRHRKEVYR